MEAKVFKPVAFIEVLHAMGLLGTYKEVLKSKEALEGYMGRRQVLFLRIRRQHEEVKISCKTPKLLKLTGEPVATWKKEYTPMKYDELRVV